MRKIIIVLTTDSKDTIDFIRKDLKSEINCCSNTYEVKSIEESEGK